MSLDPDPQVHSENHFLKLMDSLGVHLNGIEYSDFYSEPLKITGVPFSSFSTFIFCQILKKNPKKDWMIILATEREAKQVYEELELFYTVSAENKPDQILCIFPTWGMPHFNYSKPEPFREGMRSRTLSLLLEHDNPIALITSIDALLIKTPSLKNYRNSKMSLRIGENASMGKLQEYLIQYGYERAMPLEKQGEFCIKGSLIDIFCPGYFNPIRIDFLGDQIESIRFFDPLSQSSIEKVEKINIFPRRDILFEEKMISSIRSSKKFQEFIAQRSAEDPSGYSENIPPFLREESDTQRMNEIRGFWDVYPSVTEVSSIFSYYDTPPVILLQDSFSILKRLRSIREEHSFLFKKSKGKFHLTPEELFWSDEVIEKHLKNAHEILPISESIDHISAKFKEAPLYRGRVSDLVKEMNLNFKQMDVFICPSTNSQRERIQHILSAYQEDIQFQYFFLSLGIKTGFSWKNGILLTEKEIFGKRVKRQAISKDQTQIIESFIDLKEGDYVVHVNHGIGRFINLIRMQVGGYEKDFLEVAYAGQDKLYVPVEQINLVHRYIGSTEDPDLDHLGKRSSWRRTKKRAQESIEKLAQELLDLYAKREKSKGIIYPPDSPFQEEYEANFEHEETDDQINAINDIKKDMQSARPMDRLICGDVGYGKTEVAMRASFKAVMAGKQVALLCPTTILAFQHFHTFKKRFHNYPVSIDYISRFRSSSEKKEILQKLENGSLDIIIGTHSLLSKNISFKNFGLLVVDEEQKFGVVHKESIKKMRANIDTITMTATPIPRTLQLSLVNIRDLSLIKTPPRNRRSIETFVLAYNQEILDQAIEKELNRNGQIYILQNKIKTIEVQASSIQRSFPRARIAILHAKMNEQDVEMTMLGFLNYEYDILVCTTIIESGIDIANVNTLIVMNSHTFGLSQLYQLKGRVGRSDRQAYAYLFYPDRASITEVAQKRLNTLEEYNELGSGFKIAMKDLEIRGAGNILGKEQSGDIMAIGFELYIQMLQEKIHSLRHKEKEFFGCSVIIPQDFYILDDFIPDTRQKMEFYKKLVSANTLQNIAEVEEQLLDRFGKLPDLLMKMIHYEEIRILGNQLRLDQIKWESGCFILSASSETQISAKTIHDLVQTDPQFKLDPNRPQNIYFYPEDSKGDSILPPLKKLLQKIILQGMEETA